MSFIAHDVAVGNSPDAQFALLRCDRCLTPYDAPQNPASTLYQLTEAATASGWTPIDDEAAAVCPECTARIDALEERPESNSRQATLVNT